MLVSARYLAQPLGSFFFRVKPARASSRPIVARLTAGPPASTNSWVGQVLAGSVALLVYELAQHHSVVARQRRRPSWLRARLERTSLPLQRRPPNNRGDTDSESLGNLLLGAFTPFPCSDHPLSQVHTQRSAHPHLLLRRAVDHGCGPRSSHLIAAVSTRCPSSSAGPCRLGPRARSPAHRPHRGRHRRRYLSPVPVGTKPPARMRTPTSVGTTGG